MFDGIPVLGNESKAIDLATSFLLPPDILMKQFSHSAAGLTTALCLLSTVGRAQDSIKGPDVEAVLILLH